MKSKKCEYPAIFYYKSYFFRDQIQIQEFECFRIETREPRVFSSATRLRVFKARVSIRDGTGPVFELFYEVDFELELEPWPNLLLQIATEKLQFQMPEGIT